MAVLILLVGSYLLVLSGGYICVIPGLVLCSFVLSLASFLSQHFYLVFLCSAIFWVSYVVSMMVGSVWNSFLLYLFYFPLLAFVV